MQNNSNTTTITIKKDTYDILQSLKSCFRFGYKKNINYDELIKKYVLKGIETEEPRIMKLYALMEEQQFDQTEESIQEDTEPAETGTIEDTPAEE